VRTPETRQSGWPHLSRCAGLLVLLAALAAPALRAQQMPAPDANATLAGSTSKDPRFQRVGNQLMCTCGCNEGLLVCNHVDCATSLQMRKQLVQELARTPSDNAVLAAFSQAYGAVVIAVPAKSGFDLLAWVMPWVAAAIGLLLVLLVVRYWSRRESAPAAAGAQASPELTRQALSAVHSEIERELKELE
jgi:cytochrome c-type biogenesis protein CcmH